MKKVYIFINLHTFTVEYAAKHQHYKLGHSYSLLQFVLSYACRWMNERVCDVCVCVCGRKRVCVRVCVCVSFSNKMCFPSFQGPGPPRTLVVPAPLPPGPGGVRVPPLWTLRLTVTPSTPQMLAHCNTHTRMYMHAPYTHTHRSMHANV